MMFFLSTSCSFERIVVKCILIKRTRMAWPGAEMSRSLEKSKANAQGSNNMSENWAGIPTVTGGQLMCQIYYK